MTAEMTSPNLKLTSADSALCLVEPLSCEAGLFRELYHAVCRSDVAERNSNECRFVAGFFSV